MEYEDNYSQNTLQSLKNNSFLLMEPETKKILVLRSDITPQVAKLASTKLKHYARPLRLAYSGEVIRNSKISYNSEKQFRQIGVELIGGSNAYSLVEILDITINSLAKLKIKNINIDFSLPAIFRYIDKNLDLKIKSNRLVKEALENKDTSVIKNNKFEYINGLIILSGTVEDAKRNFKKYKFPKKISKMLQDFFKLVTFLKKYLSPLSITVDITEGKSFLEYNSFGFKIYNKDNAQPIAVGGDYLSNNNEIGLGISFLVSKILEAVETKKIIKIYVPYKLDINKKKVKKDTILIKELFPKKNPFKEAKKHGCNFIFNKNGNIDKV